MTYSLWSNGHEVGHTTFELSPAPRKHAGMFHPTEFGLTILPAITAAFPALLEFGEMCRRSGVDTESDDPATASAALDTFVDTPEGRRMMAAMRQVAQLELRDPRGRTVAWESIMISDTKDLLAAAAKRGGSVAHTAERLRDEPMRYLISATFASLGDGASSTGFASAAPTVFC